MSKSAYPSKYTDKKIGASQYLADEICERIAKKAGETLPYKYWNVPRWKKIYLHQVTAAGKLLQECDVLAIMAFLRSFKGRNITSLGLKKQILEGISIRSEIINRNIDLIEDYGEEYLSYDEEIEEISSGSQVSLWEKLNG